MQQREAIAAMLRTARRSRDVVHNLRCGLTTVYKVRKLMSVGKDLKAFPRSGRPKTTVAPRKVAGVLRRVKAAPNKSLWQVAVETGSMRSTVQ